MRTLVAGAAAVALLATPVLAAGPRPVSEPARYGDCSSGLPEAEASPALARPDDPVLVWQQDVGHAAAGDVDTDAAGLLSTAGPLAGCGAGGSRDDLLSAPSLATAPDGTVWAAATVYGPSGAQVRLAHLPPGGTWRSEVVAELGPPANLNYLSASVAVAPATPTTPLTVHVAYVRNHFPAHTLTVHRSRTVGGEDDSWSQENPISVGLTPAAYEFAVQLVSLGEDDLLAVSTEIQQAGFAGLAADYATRQDLTQAPVEHRARISRDGGATWSLPSVALQLENGGVRDRERTGTALRSLVRPSVAVGPDGTVHVAGESVATDGSRTSVLVASSADGVRWSTRPAAVVPGVALAAAVAVDGRGRLAVSWLDLSGDVPGDAGLTARWRWAAEQQKGWSKPRPLTDAFDLRLLAPAYVGDQGALLGAAEGFLAAPVVGTGDGRDPSQVLLVDLR